MRAILITMATVTVSLFAATSADARPPRRTHAPPAPARQTPQPQAQAPAQQPQQSQTGTAPAPQAQEQPSSQENAGASSPAAGFELYRPPGGRILQTPVSNLFPGAPPARQTVKNPVEGNAEAIQRGMAYFNTFNCVGCHAANGGGGMGPALSNRFFIYGGGPDNIYLSIYQGRPNGMPSWGAMLPENIIWDLVAYIQSISQAPTSGWGKTASHDAWKSEQLPAEFSQTATPWSQTERFSYGQSPTGRK
jgi:cytochrome c oxidase cbb3-type subunit III